jgi:hypothetical protein
LKNQEDKIEEKLPQRKEKRMNQWRSKAIHGKFYNELYSNGYIDRNESSRWLSTADIYSLKLRVS